MNTRKGIALMILSSMTTCTGQLMWKLAASADKGLPLLALGFLLYGIGALLMIIAFRFGEVSVLQPMLSVGFVISLLLGAMVLGEQITVQKVIGVVLIVAGMICLGMSGKEGRK